MQAECRKDWSEWGVDSTEEREGRDLEEVWSSEPRKHFSHRWPKSDKLSVANWAENVRYQYESGKRVVRVIRWQARHRHASSREEIALQLFHGEAEKWKVDTMHLSSTTKMISHPSYLRIIGLAREFRKGDLERLLLEELESEPDHWFGALEAITGQNPVRPEDDFDASVDAWLDWGRKEGIIAHDNAERTER
jgi:hypothetical protein